MGTVLTPILSATAGTPRSYNLGLAETYSWLPIEGDALGRPLYARASYITNFSDMSIFLSASELSIGAVTIKDNNSGLNADVVDVPGYGAGLQVLTQDLESDIDDITIGDKEGHYADVVPHLSALQVTVTNLNDSPNLDAFGRLRISNPISLFDSKNIYDNGIFFWNYKQRDGQEIFLSNDSSKVASVTASGGYFVKETYKRFGYQPGKSQLLLFTGVLSAENDVIKREGVFRSLSGDDYTEKLAGLYFQAYKTSGMADNESYAWVINNADNLVPSQSATQAEWNLDKMDGSGPSGVDLDFSKSQIFVTDFEWLGVGRVRCGFNIDGKTYYCHEFLNANNITGTYMIDPNLPIRYEIRSTGGTGSMKTICCSLMTEGGADSPAYITRSASLSSSISPTVNNRRGLIGIRLRPDRSDAVNEIVTVDILPQIDQQNTFGPYKWELVMRPTPAVGVNWVDVGTSSSIQYAQGSATLQVSGGTVIATGFGNRDTKIELLDPLFNKCVRLGRSLDQIPDELWLVITYYANPQATWAAMTWGEGD
jgi:hypothetical protein